MPSAPESEQLQAALHARLVESGEWHRILEILRRGLSESGWQAELQEKALGHAKAQETLSLPELVQMLQVDAQASVPAALRAEVTAELHSFVSRNVEET
ncbi:hypothetical protein FA09DRAFT_336350 [Tilletiopsis washingtonensis]|uniref:Transcription and mRNA export factor SUS1 n=1 Tax=Tilletiopsis washingtonensis TaxID=58919 RepID=A0A316ZIP5_9BASI|nr:hypothetical protein FA09DRAFT_336350 [Tilletiopsis washingtonensis]PWO00959.1 hypothetical protein FA09DRAFT_336350 [Tilletiopsis washingtonensis]